jgi:putative ABC transport system permease protein
MPQSLIYALRQLLKSPVFTIVSVVMLALGIGISTSNFSILNSVLLSSLPFPEGDRLEVVYTTSPQSQMMPLAPGTFLDVRSAATCFSEIAAIVPQNANVAEPGKTPEQQFGLAVSANFLSILEIQPAIGRGFINDEDQPGKASVVILTDTFWRKQFGADPKILGKTLRIGTTNATVIGVLPKTFDHTLVWYGCAFLQNETIYPSWATQRKDKWMSMMGRLGPGVTLHQANAQLAAIAARLDHDHPAENGVDGLRATSLASSFVDAGSRKLSWLVLSLSVLVLVIACSNLASVQMARAFGRSHEFAVRAALGAGRLDIMAPLLVESLLLTIAGAALGLVASNSVNHIVAHYFVGDFEISLDWHVLTFACTAALATALIFGLAPAWLASRVSTGDALKESSRGNTSSRTQRRLKFSLIVGQLALALVLVSAALSFSIAVKKFLKRDLGWQPAGLVSGTLNIPYNIFMEDGKKPVLVGELRRKLAEVPGVERVSFATGVPIQGYQDQKKVIVEDAAPLPTGQEPSAFVTGVDSGFFATMGIPLKEGRLLPETRKEGAPSLIVVNESMARRFWPGQSAVGKRIQFTDVKGWNEVAGVVGDVSIASSFDTPATRLQVYWDLQSDRGIWYNFIVKSSRPPDALGQELRKAIGSVNVDLLVEGVGGVPQILENMLAGNNLTIIALSTFAAIGLVIALVGLYGVMSQLTQQRGREIGIRMALGADYGCVVRMILAQGGILITIGIVIGLFGSIAVAAVFRQTMPELRLPNAGLYVGTTVLLCAAGLIACFIPARRAGRIDPTSALRAE